MSHWEDPITKSEFERLENRVIELEAQVARMQNVIQCEECLKLHQGGDFHFCFPVARRKSPEEGQVI